MFQLTKVIISLAGKCLSKVITFRMCTFHGERTFKKQIEKMYNGHSKNQVVLTHMSIMIHVYIYEEHIHTSRYTMFHPKTWQK